MSRQRIPCDVFYVDRASVHSLQVQLRQAVTGSIVEGRMLPGDQLPSTRQLAEHLGLSRITVTQAYQELIAQGFVDAVSRSSYRIADSSAEPSPALSDALDDVQPVDWTQWLAGDLSQRRRIRKPADWRLYPYPFIYGQLDASVFDRSAWMDCVRRAHDKRDFEDMARDVAAADDPVLVNYIASRTLPRRGISAQPDEILVTLGAQNALWLTIQLLARKKLHAVCERPGHPDIASSLELFGARISMVDVDEKGLRVDDIPAGVGAVFVTPSHHSPTSTTMVRERREQLIRRATESNFLIVEDDYEFEMSFLHSPSPALKSLDAAGRVIYAGSFSKSLFPGLRLGYLVGPKPFIEQARHLRALMFRHPSGHLQRTVAYFLSLGYLDKHAGRLRQVLKERHELLQATLAETALKVMKTDSFGGSSLWIEGPPGLDSHRLAGVVREQGVLIEPGSPFFSNADQPSPFFRLGFSSIATERIQEGIRRIVAGLDASVT